MYLERLRILNYKNIRETDLTLSPKINCFIGNNGVGKTNLLDAVYYLSFCKSQTNTIDSQNITHSEEFLMLDGQYQLSGEKVEIYCGLKRRQRKQFKRDKKEYERISDHIGTLPLVLISPGDQELIIGGSSERRKFLDGFISQFNHNYLNAFLAYNKNLAQRNALLKGDSLDPTLMDILDEQLAEHGEYIHQQRTQFLTDFTPKFQELHKHLSLGREQVSLQYQSSIPDGERLFDLLQANRQRDQLIGFTTKGIHKDDLEMNIEDYPIRRIGSQGQNKTYLTALKLAQFEFLREQKGVTPILLLDDIFDKLDRNRVEQIIALIKGNRFGQVFISDTDREHISEILQEADCEYKLFLIEEGEVTQI